MDAKAIDPSVRSSLRPRGGYRTRASRNVVRGTAGGCPVESSRVVWIFPALFFNTFGSSILFTHTDTYRRWMTFSKVALDSWWETRPTRAGSDRSRAGGYRMESDDDDDDVGDVVL